MTRFDYSGMATTTSTVTAPPGNEHSTHSQAKSRSWKNRFRPSARTPEESRDAFHASQAIVRTTTHGTRASSRRRPAWWKIRLFHGMWHDIKRRAPFYISDWLDAWDYRVIPATVYMYFAKYASSIPCLSKHLQEGLSGCSSWHLSCEHAGIVNGTA